MIKIEYGDFRNGYRAFTKISAVAEVLSKMTGEFQVVCLDGCYPHERLQVQQFRMFLSRIAAERGKRYITKTIGGELMVLLLES